MRDDALDALIPAEEFVRAAELFISIRAIAETPGAIAARYVRETTETGYRNQAKSLGLFFAGMKLEEIHWHHMRAYQEARVAGAPPFIRKRRPHEEPAPCPVKAAQVNQETAFLKRLKRLAGCWTEQDERYFRKLIEPDTEAQRALSPEEQALWIDMCRTKERWALVLWYSLLAIDTTMSTNELRGLRLGDIHREYGLIKVPWGCAKNPYRKREIAIEDAEALWALDQLVDRARGLGSTRPMDHLFPWRDTRANAYVPERHMSESGLKKLWQEVRDATGLTWLRQYDLRHTGGTRLAEEGVPVDIIMARMGHASEEMRQHYTHISQSAQRRWLRRTETPVGSGFGPRSERRAFGGFAHYRARA